MVPPGLITRFHCGRRPGRAASQPVAPKRPKEYAPLDWTPAQGAARRRSEWPPPGETQPGAAEVAGPQGGYTVCASAGRAATGNGCGATARCRVARGLCVTFAQKPGTLYKRAAIEETRQGGRMPCTRTGRTAPETHDVVPDVDVVRRSAQEASVVLASAAAAQNRPGSRDLLRPGAVSSP